ncbi:hypothetical protein NL676_021357 [Syzygium grande]|nr:hypothetical protein NL676_021357 [Syzygium grande]
MHGRPRTAPKLEDDAASTAKAQKLTALQSRFLSNHRNRITCTISLAEKIKSVVSPERFLLIRKLAVGHYSLPAAARVCASVLVRHPSPPQAPIPRRCDHSDEFEDEKLDMEMRDMMQWMRLRLGSFIAQHLGMVVS